MNVTRHIKGFAPSGILPWRCVVLCPYPATMACVVSPPCECSTSVEVQALPWRKVVCDLTAQLWLAEHRSFSCASLPSSARYNSFSLMIQIRGLWCFYNYNHDGIGLISGVSAALSKKILQHLVPPERRRCHGCLIWELRRPMSYSPTMSLTQLHVCQRYGG